MELKERVKAFLEDTGATITAFCKRIDISITYYYKWMNGSVVFSDKLNERITKFLDDVYTK